MNYRSVEACQHFLDLWKDQIEQDLPIDSADMVDAVTTLYANIKAIEKEYFQEAAVCDQYRERAREEHHKDGECEIDNNAVVSLSEDGGAYVQAWVWVYGPVKGEPHDYLCTTCNEQLDQCHDEDCTESDHHHAHPPQFCSPACEDVDNEQEE